ncbi:MAG: hypothetical protein ACTHYJ_11010 [Brevibacterium yomogidense]|uniref:hypothetical protein n=1 Tax=Brevibacterium sp. Mu109 TaxID=1255669 RepID=UPI000C5ABEB8|nr:hypothetical protein [Brevibacterium sp. Mu109]SMX92415.1 hypothetical protein BSP109_02631 [Brevibacterium sp. Mu109]
MSAQTDAPQTRHRSSRGRLIAAGAVILVLLAVAAWSGLTHWQLARASAQFESGDYTAAQESADRFLDMSPFERHKGHFAAGTALAGDGALDEAEAELETALSTAPARDECAVRVNLALVQEGQADAFRDADDVDAANDRYDAARTTLREAPEECRPDGSGQDEEMDSQEQRVDESQEEMNNPSSGGEGGEEGTDGDDGSDGGDSEDGDGGDSDSDGSGGGEESQDGSGGDTSGEESGESDERMEELEKRRQESEERHSQTNEGGTGSGVREPGSKPW